jgi:hypothetical protein
VVRRALKGVYIRRSRQNIEDEGAVNDDGDDGKTAGLHSQALLDLQERGGARVSGALAIGGRGARATNANDETLKNVFAVLAMFTAIGGLPRAVARSRERILNLCSIHTIERIGGVMLPGPYQEGERQMFTHDMQDEEEIGRFVVTIARRGRYELTLYDKQQQSDEIETISIVELPGAGLLIAAITQTWLQMGVVIRQ